MSIYSHKKCRTKSDFTPHDSRTTICFRNVHCAIDYFCVAVLPLRRRVKLVVLYPESPRIVPSSIWNEATSSAAAIVQVSTQFLLKMEEATGEVVKGRKLLGVLSEKK
jgi:hypothetical protein